MGQKSTTPSLIKRNKCYCLKQKKVIAISRCKMFEGCEREKSCRTKSNKDYTKSVKK